MNINYFAIILVKKIKKGRINMNKDKKKIAPLILIVIIFVLVLTGCKNQENETNSIETGSADYIYILGSQTYYYYNGIGIKIMCISSCIYTISNDMIEIIGKYDNTQVVVKTNINNVVIVQNKI